jgi:hypothetical protein
MPDRPDRSGQALQLALGELHLAMRHAEVGLCLSRTVFSLASYARLHANPCPAVLFLGSSAFLTSFNINLALGT